MERFTRAVRGLDEALKFLEQCRAQPETASAAGCFKDSREWLESAARELLAAAREEHALPMSVLRDALADAEEGEVSLHAGNIADADFRLAQIAEQLRALVQSAIQVDENRSVALSDDEMRKASKYINEDLISHGAKTSYGHPYVFDPGKLHAALEAAGISVRPLKDDPHAKRTVDRAEITRRIREALPSGEGYDGGFRDALESMALAFTGKASVGAIEEAVQTALDAFSNNAPAEDGDDEAERRGTKP